MAIALRHGTVLRLDYSLWLGVLRLHVIYEERTPRTIQDTVYEVAKHLPRLVFDGLFSLVVWSATRSGRSNEFSFFPFGADRFLPDVSWAPSVVIGTLALFALSFWSTPERLKAPPPRGGILRTGAGKPLQEKTKTPSRGRTIRSYQDIR